MCYTHSYMDGINVIEWLTTFIDMLVRDYGYFGFFVFGIFNFVIPSEPVLILAGTQVYSGKFNFFLVVLSALLGSAIKTSIIFSIGYFIGKEFLIKYSKYTHFKEEYIDFVKQRVTKYGYRIVTLVQFIPIVRRYVSAPFGLLRLNFARFMFYNMIGVALWFSFLTLVGFLVGKTWDKLSSKITPFFNLFGLLIILFIFCIIIYEYFLHKKKSKVS
jgi:membrane protein DedA with SNARE-associated domain